MPHAKTIQRRAAQTSEPQHDTLPAARPVAQRAASTTDHQNISVPSTDFHLSQINLLPDGPSTVPDTTHAPEPGPAASAWHSPTPVLQRAVGATDFHLSSINTTPSDAQQSPTGLPDSLRFGIEALSGVSMDNVNVSYNSPKPAEIDAQAYAQGNNIYVAPGQERHMPHEAWHVVQQRRGQVQPTAQLRGTAINDDPALEQEADRMGAQAAQTDIGAAQPAQRPASQQSSGAGVIQGMFNEPTSDEAEEGGTQLEPENIKEMFTGTMRGGVKQYAKLMDMTTEAGVYTEALKFAKITYDNVVEGLKGTWKGLVEFPSADELTSTDFVEAKVKEIKENKSIKGAMWEEHLAEFTAEYNKRQQGASQVDAAADEGGKSKMALTKTPEQYLEDYSRDARSKLAYSWSEPASKVVDLQKLVEAQRKQGFAEQLKARTAAKEGRDVPGRLAYYLMNVSDSDISETLVGHDAKDGAGKQRGMGQLGLNIASAFSDAACHNDARRMADLMSAGLFTSGSRIVAEKTAQKELSQVILDDVLRCPGARKVLKLTNYDNHSVVYLVGDNKATKYESIASPDSTSILYNDLIRHAISSSDLKQSLEAGVAAISAGGENKLEWEVHRATTLEQMKERVDKRLQKGSAEVNISLALAAHEKQSEVDNREEDYENYPAEPVDHSHGMDINKYSLVTLPLALINGGTGSSAALYHMSGQDESSPAELQQGASYRMHAQGRWMKVTYEGMADEKQLPEWMKPSGKFKVVEVLDKYKNPQMRDPLAGETKQTVMQFVYQTARNPGLRQVLERPSGADYPKEHGDYVIVEDPLWESGGFGRQIIFRAK